MENNNLVKWLDKLYVYWNLLNNWNIDNRNVYLYWKIDNIFGNMTASTYLKWNQIDDYTNYILSITWEDDISLSTTQYLLPTSIKEDWTNLYWKVKGDWIFWDSDWTDEKCINVLWCVQIWTLDFLEPNNLMQFIHSPELEEDELEEWEKVWKYQSGSWIIFKAFLENNWIENIKLAVDIYKNWINDPVYTDYSDYIIGSSWTWEVIVNYSNLWSWDYYWKARVENELWKSTTAIHYWENEVWETDFTLYEWFEPYPYWYDFYNKSVATWTLDYLDKWTMFYDVFDTSEFDDDWEMLSDAYESVWLNKDNPFQWWNCYGMAVSAGMQYSHPEFMSTKYYTWFYDNIWTTGTVREDIDEPNLEDWYWNDYDGVLKTILSFQLFQYSTHAKDAENNWTDNVNNILEDIRDYPNIDYVITFKWTVEIETATWTIQETQWHAVIPYKVEWNKIYFRDNNIQYPNRWSYLAYNQYIEVLSNWNWKIWLYENNWWISFDSISLMNIDDLYYWWVKTAPNWFDWSSSVYTLSWSSDLYVIDNFGNKSWFIDWKIIEEVPWVNVIIPFNTLLKWTINENTWKQIQVTNNENLKVKIIWKKKENYDLMIAWWDYYTKISWVEINKWELDEYEFSNKEIKIKFDKQKKWDYNIKIDNFDKELKWNVKIDNIKVLSNLQKFSIDWNGLKNKVDKNNKISNIIYEEDEDGDGIYDKTIELVPLESDSKYYKFLNK